MTMEEFPVKNKKESLRKILLYKLISIQLKKKKKNWCMGGRNNWEGDQQFPSCAHWLTYARA